jgi:hypothetical protein
MIHKALSHTQEPLIPHECSVLVYPILHKGQTKSKRAGATCPGPYAPEQRWEPGLSLTIQVSARGDLGFLLRRNQG